MLFPQSKFLTKKEYITSLILWLASVVLFNTIIYFWLAYEQKDKDQILLGSIQENIRSLVSNNLLIEDAANQKIPSKNSKLALKINTLLGRLDLPSFKNILDKLIPSHIIYKITVDAETVAFAKHYDSSNDIKYIPINYKLADGTNVSIELAIDTNSLYYFHNQQKLYRKHLIIGLISFVFSLAMLVFYLKFKANFLARIITLATMLTEAEGKFARLVASQDVWCKLRSSFIQKATEIYANKQKEKAGFHEEMQGVDALQSSEDLFPIFLSDNLNSRIRVNELILDLKDFLAPYYEQIAIKFQTNTDYVAVNCSREVFTQLLFSLVFNLAKFMEDQSEMIKVMEINFNPNQIKILSEGFPLEERMMISYSKNIFCKLTDVFLLDCQKLFIALRANNFIYNIKYIDGYNSIEIEQSNSKESKNSSKVLQFPQQRRQEV
jgi:hypothetical protein